MNNKSNVISEPYEVGLKNLEIFYNPELLMQDWVTEIDMKHGSFKKTIITAATIAALHNSPDLVARNFTILNNQVTTGYVEKVLNRVEEIETKFTQAFDMISNKNQKNFTEAEISEMEALDDYHSQTKKFFLSKKKISF